MVDARHVSNNIQLVSTIRGSLSRSAQTAGSHPRELRAVAVTAWLLGTVVGGEKYPRLHHNQFLVGFPFELTLIKNNGSVLNMLGMLTSTSNTRVTRSNQFHIDTNCLEMWIPTRMLGEIDCTFPILTSLLTF